MIEWTTDEENLIWETEQQQMLPEEERECPVCRGERLMRFYDGLSVKPVHCQECKGTGLLIWRQGVVYQPHKGETFVPSCPKCGDFMWIKEGEFGEFYGCEDFPSCRAVRLTDPFGRFRPSWAMLTKKSSA